MVPYNLQAKSLKVKVKESNTYKVKKACRSCECVEDVK